MSDRDYAEEVEMPRREPEPLAKICVWCDVPHEYQAGAYPASHGMCPTAAAKQFALIDAETLRERPAE